MNSTLPMGIARAAIINMSSALGSISENESGGLYPYRCAKVTNVISNTITSLYKIQITPLDLITFYFIFL